jgi:gliding motility-associated-like protein
VKNNSLENLFRDKLNNIEGDVNPDLWNNINNNLPKAEPNPSKINWKGGAAIATTVILIGSIIGYSLLPKITINSNEPETISSVSNNQENFLISENVSLLVEENRNLQMAVKPEELTKKLDVKETILSKNSVNENFIEEPKVIISSDNNKKGIDNSQISNKKQLYCKKEEKNTNMNRIAPATGVSEEISASILYRITEENPLKVNFSANKENLFYDWTFGDGGLHSSEASPFHTYEKEGKYEVICILSDDKGNKIVTSKELIEVVEPIISYVPTSFTPNQDGINDTYKVIVDNTKIAAFKMDIYDLRGKLVFTTNNPNDAWPGPQVTNTINIQDSYYAVSIVVKSISGKTYKEMKSITVN